MAPRRVSPLSLSLTLRRYAAVWWLVRLFQRKRDNTWWQGMVARHGGKAWWA
ncbi:hypothetical protein GCM10009546_73700 [Actinomadura livida]|uniref:Uncharacterized protein n=1 Tax=Actinomadura livida TaxID=79909 RepID=A0A7W7IH71_9ACTN|nr:hypothetical protein [Actinomadura catellatispora]GGU36885.1 hypothetical protein GCM10010208_71690 [Actinomadura livida]